MDLRFLRSFMCIAETGSVSRASSMLNTVQPALSRQMRLLEEELGTQLFVRHRRGVALTEAGEMLREHAAAILASLEDAKHAVSAAGREPSGSLSFAIPTSMLYICSGEIVESFCERYPKVFLHVFEGLGHVVEAHLREGNVDAAILISPKPLPGIAIEPLVAEPICVVGPVSANLSMSKSAPLEMLARVPMLVFPSHNKVRIEAEAAIARAGLQLNMFAEVEGQPLLIDLVRRGLGYAVMPYCAAQGEVLAGTLSASPIEGTSVTWELGINRARAGAPAVKALVALIRSVVAEKFRAGLWHDHAQPAAKPKRARA